MARSSISFIVFVSFVICMTNAESNREKRTFFDDISGYIGQGIGAVSNVLLPKETQRAACQSYGFIDPQFVKTAGHTSTSTILGNVGGFLLDTAGTILPLNPKKGWKKACMEAGLYHPNQQQLQQPDPTIQVDPTPPQPPPPNIVYVYDPPTTVNG